MDDEKRLELQYWILQGRTLVLEQRAGGQARRIAQVQATGSLEQDLAEAYLTAQAVPHEQRVDIRFIGSQDGESRDAFYSMTRNGGRVVYVQGMDAFAELEKLAFAGDWDDAIAEKVKARCGLLRDDGIIPEDSIGHRRLQALGHIYMFSDLGLVDKVEELKRDYENKAYVPDPNG